jgi:hypothetical protein
MAFVIGNFTGFETGDTQEADSWNGTLAFDTGVLHSGTYSLRLDAHAEWYDLLIDPAGLKTTPTYVYFGFYLRFDDVTATSDLSFCRIQSDGAGNQAYIGIDTSSNLYVSDANNTKQDTGSTTLEIDTWYKVEVRFFNNASGYIHVYLDNNSTPECTATAIDTDNGLDTAQVRFTWETAGLTNIYFDDLYIKVDTADGSTSDLIGVGDGLDWEIPGYYQSAGTGISSNGTAPAAGSLAGTGDLPRSDSNEAEWTGSSDDAEWATDGTVRSGPASDITGTSIAGKYWYRVDRDGGGSTTHTLKTGYYDGAVWTNFESDARTDIPQGQIHYWYIQTTNIPTTTSHEFLFGITISGVQDLHVWEAGAWLLQTIEGEEEPSTSAWWIFFNK